MTWERKPQMKEYEDVIFRALPEVQEFVRPTSGPDGALTATDVESTVEKENPKNGCFYDARCGIPMERKVRLGRRRLVLLLLLLQSASFRVLVWW